MDVFVLRMEMVQGWDGTRVGGKDYGIGQDNGLGKTRDPKPSSLTCCP